VERRDARGLARDADRESPRAEERGLGVSVRREAIGTCGGRCLLTVVEREVGAVGTMNEREAAAPDPARGGCTTQIAAAAAIAASTTEPPARRTSAPAAAARGCSVATAPPGGPAASAGAVRSAKQRRRETTAARLTRAVAPRQEPLGARDGLC